MGLEAAGDLRSGWVELASYSGWVGSGRVRNVRRDSAASGWKGAEEMRIRRLLVGGLFALLVLVTGCGGTSGEDTTTTTTSQPPTTTLAATTTTTEVEPEPVLVSEVLAGFEPRSVVFANVEFTITGAMISNQELRSYAEGGEPIIDEDNLYVYLDISAQNLMSSTQTEAFGPEIYKLVVDDRELDAASEMSFLSEVAGIIRPNTTVDTFLAFPISDGVELGDAALLIGVRPDRKASLPLTGDVAANPYPIQVELSGSAEGVGPTNGGTIVFTLVDATLSEDLPHEHANSPTGLRADEDELFLVVHVLAEKVAGRGNDLLSVDAFRLLVDGLPRSPWDSAIDPLGSNESPTAEPGAVVDAWVAFLAPIDATELALQAGDLADPAVIPLNLPDLP